MQAQEELREMEDAVAWIELLRSLKDPNPSLLRLLTTHLSVLLGGGRGREITALMGVILETESHFIGHKDHLRRLMEVYLRNRRVGIEDKGEILTGVIRRSGEEVSSPQYKDVLIFAIRGLGQLRIKSALPELEAILDGRQDEIVYEIIRALRFIPDARSSRILEKLFGGGNREAAAAAIEAYEAIGVKWRGMRRLYRLYPQADRSVKESIILVVLKFKPALSARILKRFYEVETDSDVKYHLIRKMASVSHSVTAAFLMKLASTEKEPRLRMVADWGSQVIPAGAMMGALRKSLRSRDRMVRRTAVLKLGKLPLEQALPLLKPFLRKRKSLDPLIRLAVIETLCRLPTHADLDEWLLDEVGREPLYRVTAMTGIMRRPDPPVLEIFRRIDSLGVQPLKAMLALLPDHRSTVADPKVLDEAEKYLDHAEPEVSYLSSRVLIRSGRPELFIKVWEQAIREDRAHWDSFAALIGQAVSDAQASMLWIADSSHTEQGYEFLRLVLRHVNTGVWTLERWREMLRGLVGKAVETRRLDPQQTQIIRSLCASQGHFWGEIFDDLLVQERDPDYLRVFSLVAGIQADRIREETLRQIFDNLVNGVYGKGVAPALALLAVARRRALLEDYLRWLMSLQERATRSQGFLALIHWLGPLGEKEEPLHD